MILTDIRSFKYENEHGRTLTQTVKYEIQFDGNGKVENVWNEFNNSISKTSEVFNYYKTKFQK